MVFSYPFALIPGEAASPAKSVDASAMLKMDKQSRVRLCDSCQAFFAYASGSIQIGVQLFE